jgi:hypothetical protein
MVLAPFFATMSAIIPKIQTYFVNNQQNAKEHLNRVKWITSGNFNVTILKKGNFLYICLVNNLPGKYLDED